jgi:hypothetical protein
MEERTRHNGAGKKTAIDPLTLLLSGNQGPSKFY